MLFAKIARVLRLVAARRVREGHEQGGLCKGEQFEHRVAPRPREGEVGARVGARHVRLKFSLHIPARAMGRKVALSAQVQDVEVEQKGCKTGAHRLVDGAAAAPSAQNEQNGLSPVKGVSPHGVRAHARIERAADGRADVLPVPEARRRLGEGGEHIAALARREPRAQPRCEVALMRQNGHFQAVCRPDGGIAHISALGKDEVGRMAFHHAQRRPVRGGEAEGDGEILCRKRAAQLGTIHHKIGAADCRNKGALHAVRAHIGERIAGSKFLHEGKIGDDVPRASAARKENAFHFNSICPRPEIIDAGQGRTAQDIKNSCTDFKETGKIA